MNTSKCTLGAASLQAVLVTLMRACEPEAMSDGTAVVDECTNAAEYFAMCTGAVLADLASGCKDESDRGSAGEILDLECAELRTLVSENKFDGGFGWKTVNQRCWLNLECIGTLVCRPIDRFESVSVCLPRGTSRFRTDVEMTCGEYCDSDADCGESLLCLGESIYAAGMCLAVWETPATLCE